MPLATLCTTSFNIHKIYILPAESISELHTVLMTNSDYFLIILQLSLIVFTMQTSTVHCAAQIEYLLNIAVNYATLKI
jgi:hypothetical protein